MLKSFFPDKIVLGLQAAASLKLHFALSEAAGSNEHILTERPRGKSDFVDIHVICNV